jgi:hypothetical protein
MRTLLIGSLAACCVVGATLVPASGASAAINLRVPFYASVSGTAQLTSQSTGTFTGSGYAMYLGAVTNHGSVVAFFDEPSATCPNGFASMNTETFTARDGETLSIQSSDVTCPIGDPQTSTQFRGTGHWTVTGGTGRFAKTTGSGSYVGYANFGHNFSFAFSGSIRQTGGE